MQDTTQLFIEVQDDLIPILDTYEQAIYHYILRYTYLIGEPTCYFSTRTAEIGFGSGDNKRPPSMNSRSKKLRSLEAKGAVEILERTRKGILVRPILPSEIDGLGNENTEVMVDLEEQDFFKQKQLRLSLLVRENYRCFYTGRKIDESSFYLDHVIPQSARGTNSYRNLVAVCFEANSIKNDMGVQDFIRHLFREGILSNTERSELVQKVTDLQQGKIKPAI